MALTPEDVVNKRFQPTKFREGYDQDEVDDFLDEVVVELRRLGTENEELRSRLGTDGALATDGGTGDAGIDSAVVPGDAVEDTTGASLTDRSADEPVAAPPGDLDDETISTSSLLQLARRLHEEHVREGIQRKNALIAEAEASAARITADAEAAQEARVAEAEAAQEARLIEIEAAQQARIAELETEQQARLAEIDLEQQARIAEAEAAEQARIAALDADRLQLEQRIDELRSFEREYRENLKSYIEGQLRDLDATDDLSNESDADPDSPIEGSSSDRRDSAGG